MPLLPLFVLLNLCLCSAKLLLPCLARVQPRVLVLALTSSLLTRKYFSTFMLNFNRIVVTDSLGVWAYTQNMLLGIRRFEIMRACVSLSSEYLWGMHCDWSWWFLLLISPVVHYHLAWCTPHYCSSSRVRLMCCRLGSSCRSGAYQPSSFTWSFGHTVSYIVLELFIVCFAESISCYSSHWNTSTVSASRALLASSRCRSQYTP